MVVSSVPLSSYMYIAQCTLRQTSTLCNQLYCSVGLGLTMTTTLGIIMLDCVSASTAPADERKHA